MPLIASFSIAQADVVYPVVCTTLVLAVVLLVLRPGNRCADRDSSAWAPG